MKLSADTDSPIFHNAARFIGAVHLDGVLVNAVTEFNTEAGTLTRYVTEDDGELSVVGGLIETEQLTGVVTYNVHPDHIDNPYVKEWENDPCYR